MLMFGGREKEMMTWQYEDLYPLDVEAPPKYIFSIEYFFLDCLANT